MCTNEDLGGLQGLSDLAQKLVMNNNYEVCPLVYNLVTLALVHLMAIAIVERVFSMMTYAKIVYAIESKINS